MLPRLFNVYVDGVMQEVNVGVQGKDLTLVDENRREWNMTQLLFVNDLALLVESQRGLQKLMTEFGRACKT